MYVTFFPQVQFNWLNVDWHDATLRLTRVSLDLRMTAERRSPGLYNPVAAR